MSSEMKSMCKLPIYEQSLYADIQTIKNVNSVKLHEEIKEFNKNSINPMMLNTTSIGNIAYVCYNAQLQTIRAISMCLLRKIIKTVNN